MLSSRPAAYLALALSFACSTGSLRCAADEVPGNPPGAAEPNSPEEWYGAGVRPTEARTPEAEQAGFHLPPGFEIRLFAAEPEIKKPMNIAFDTAGRLWVTDTLEYPYPAPDGQTGRDSVRILEDTDGDGRADKVTTFADGLNIPIGVLPYGEGCICYSIPNLWYLRDTDGDGTCDQRDRILGPFDTTRDTHGMVNSLRAGEDGWIYACHGFSNQSRVAGTDGDAITLISGNTFRFRPDGSRVEHVTWGQVNPFGMTQDEWGYYYTADCHSKPISQLIRGGYYPSFGRPDDGLGFVPPMMDHLHGSTAIAGLAYFPANLGIDPLANQMLSGNVMTSRINRNRVVRNGATVRGEALPDFLTSDDPWFRPVDIRLGPDGHIYVADFYNRIIGHYEVPLEHPQRDRHRGRIWQIRHAGFESESPSRLNLGLPAPQQQLNTQELNTQDFEILRRRLGDPNPERRSLAVQQVASVSDPAVHRAVQHLATDHAAPAAARVSSLWCLYRWGEVSEATARQLSKDPAPEVRTHLFRMLGDLGRSSGLAQHALQFDAVVPLAVAALGDPNANVARAVAESLGRTNTTEHVPALLTRLQEADPADPILRQSIRIAIRDVLARSADGAEFMSRWQFSEAPPAMTAGLAEIALALQSQGAGRFLIDYLQTQPVEGRSAVEMLRHAAAVSAAEDLEGLVAFAAEWSQTAEIDEVDLLDQIAAARGAQGGELPEPIRRWAQSLAERELAEVEHGLSRSANGTAVQQPVRWHSASGTPWPQQTRMTVEGGPVTLTSSFPLGETTTDTLRSDVFPAPVEIEFWIAGHNGHPSEPDAGLNRVELISAETGLVLRTTVPPRRDSTERVRWDCRDIEGRPVQLRCIDGDARSAYAWLAIGGFEPGWLEPRETGSALETALRLVAEYRLESLGDRLVSLARDDALTIARRSRVAETMARLANRPRLSALLSLAAEGIGETAIAGSWIEAALSNQPIDVAEELARFSRSLSTADQQRLATRLATGRETAALLVAGIEAGHLSPSVLLDKAVESAVDAVADDAMRAQVQSLRERAATLDQADSEAVSRFLDEALVRLETGGPDAEMGRAVFVKQCAVCHQIAGEGQIIGPQLDGVGSRGPQRLLEDILAPDLNVDQAFRTTTLLTVDGAVLTGLVRDADDSQLTVAGSDGKLTSVPREDVEVQRQGTKSLMPSNFHETLTAEQLAALVAYLQQHAGQKQD